MRRLTFVDPKESEPSHVGCYEERRHFAASLFIHDLKSPQLRTPEITFAPSSTSRREKLGVNFSQLTFQQPQRAYPDDYVTEVLTAARLELDGRCLSSEQESRTQPDARNAHREWPTASSALPPG